MSAQSPKVTHFEWGRVDVEGFATPFKDVKLYPGGAREWDWSETGTRHSPGIQFADAEELLEHGATIVILSRGVRERLRTRPDTVSALEARGVVVRILQTEEAVGHYNALRETEAVGALIHSTC